MRKIIENKIAKPFLKWAGGKTQLINEIERTFPKDFEKLKFTYLEPFVGSGAILFWILNRCKNLNNVIISDINEALINTYKTISAKPNELISILEILQNEFHSLEGNEENKKIYYYDKRKLFNLGTEERSSQAALFIFLNRTCFNGLYRVNKNNLYNVPIGGYKKPTICDSHNILAVSSVLQNVEILCGDYEATLNHASANSIFYLDPPYKPLSETSSFNSYAKHDFNDNEQKRLKDFCSKLDMFGHHWILSNSDVNGENKKNSFFDDLYADYKIVRVDAKRSINANPTKRGILKELLITNKMTN